MDYKELVENAKVCCGDTEIDDCASVCINPKDKRGNDVRICRQWIVKDLYSAVVDLLSRAEAAEKELADCKEKNAGLALALLTEQPPNSDCLGDQEWKAVRNRVKEAEARAEKAEAERDAAISELKKAADDNGGCYGCKWLDDATDKCTNELGMLECDSKTNNMWQWRGMEE